MKHTVSTLLLAAPLVDANIGCPYAKLWMKHGPKKAGEILSARHPSTEKTFRRLNEAVPTGYGSCLYKNPFVAGPDKDCIQFIGEGYDDATAAKACEGAMMGMAEGTTELRKGQACPSSPQAAGFCLTDEGKPTAQASPMKLGGMMMGTCEEVANACSTWSQGRFMFTGACADGSEPPAAPEGPPVKWEMPEEPKCTIAPGPMGAGHQHARSPGYEVACAQAPGKNSPYQWPLMWTAEYESQGLIVKRGHDYEKNPDREPMTTKGRVWHDHSRNWKRSDSVSTGTFFGFGSDSEGDSEDNMNGFGFGEDMMGPGLTTMLHRGNTMIFIKELQNGTKKCTKMDMGVVGNIRPDWFMDNRGAQTGVQYIGNQHLYLKGAEDPTLVKQWRKKDFADMYFVMSITAEPDENGHHWPVQRNDPGEGFGDDNLHTFWNHEMLTDEDKDIFLVDEGLDCREIGGSEQDGPPSIEEEKPSNLNVDEAGWVNIEYTYSPEGPSLEDAMEEAVSGDCEGAASSSSSSSSVAVDLGKDGTALLCKLPDGKLAGRVMFDTQNEVYLALGIRPDGAPDHCEMYPAIGVVGHELDDGAWAVETGDIVRQLKAFEPTAAQLASFEAVPANGEFSRDGTTSEMTFTGVASLPATDPTLKLAWSFGRSPQFGYHADRGCAEVPVSKVPDCTGYAPPSAELSSEVAAATGGCSNDEMTAGFASIQEQLASLSSKIEGMNAPKTTNCATFKRAKRCNTATSCSWDARTSKCESLEASRRQADN